MKLSFALFGLSLFSSSVFSHPLDLPFAITEYETETLERRAGGVVDTRGAGGNVQPRLEIRQMQTEQPNQFSLFILAMQSFMATSQSSATSYFQIAGIHGVPRQNYNGISECSTCAQGGQTNGYCTHDSVLFPAWHRAYLALFEQEFVAVAKRIANTFPSSSRAAMVSAANTIRFPYWDWAAIPPNNGPDVPTSVSSPNIQVNGPKGQQTIPNPLYQYKFKDTSKMVYYPFTSWKTTIRWPTTESPSGKTQESAMVGAFNRIRGSLQDQVYKLLTACSDYDHFSNDRATGQGGACGNSLEGIHNTVHTTAGGPVSKGGHMTFLSTAAFDPVFWLHHANVDRLFAMWQTLHPSYGATQATVTPTWTYAKGSSQGPSSPLTPFYRSGSTFWTTQSVKQWTVFKYTYPEFQGGGGKAAIAKAVNNLYSPRATGTAGSQKRGLVPLPQGAIAQNGSAFEYLANVKAPRYALNGTYQIYVFLGDPASEDPSTWIMDDNLVGPIGVLSMVNMQDSDVPILGQIPLTRALTDKLGSGVISQLSEDVVGPLLQSMLQWRIEAPDGSSVDPETLPNFLVSVYTTTASDAGEEEIPQYSNFNLFPIATHGKKGGLVES